MSAKTKRNVLFFGTPDFAAESLKLLISDQAFNIQLVITQPDKPAGRGGKIKVSAVKEVALAHNIPVFQPISLKKTLSESIGTINKYGEYDVGVVVAFGQILPQEILDLPKAGCVNVHGSILPRWRGAAPMQRAIMSGDKETGVCLMQMDAGLDTGPVYCQETTAINEEDNFESIHDRLALMGARLLGQKLEKIISGELTAVSQNENGATYAAKIKPAECLINWQESAAEISSKVRGLSPFPGAYTMLGDKRLKIFKASPKELSNSAGKAPGDISYVDKHQLEVVCNNSALAILEVQMEGKRRMLVGEFLNGCTLSPNEKFI